MLEVGQGIWQGWQGPMVFLSRLVWSVLVWWVLTGGVADSWLVGAPAVLAAALLSSCMLPRLHVSALGALRFCGFFLAESLRGGFDVATRALHWRLPLDPGVVRHRSRTSLPAARVAVANTASLLPGTLVVDQDEADLYVHALDAGPEVRESLAASEQRVADLFSLPLESSELDRGPE
jgi:multicomponent Na+:H+ antiporter subunit E